MELMNKLQLLRAMAGGKKDSDDTLAAYLDIAGQKIINRVYECQTDKTGLEVPDQYGYLQVEIAAYLLNKRGAEGEIQHIENGTHRNYGSADVPADMMGRIVPFCGVVR